MAVKPGRELPPIEGASDLERLVSRSRLIGADPALVLHGGGNTSSKMLERDHLGRERIVLRIKGSGSDLASIDAAGFPGLYLDELLPLRDRTEMSDEEMTAYLARCVVDPAAPRPSIETLLHAFLPALHVDHVHADAICTLTNHAEAERAVHDALGEDVAVVPYIRPGFELSRRVADLADRRAVVLAKHGLVTWGETHEESYGLLLDLVERAHLYIADRRRPADSERIEDLAEDDRELLLTRLRGRLSAKRHQVVHVDPRQRALADRPDASAVAAGRATPDHILRIGSRSAVIADAASVDAVVTAFESEYAAYFERWQERLPSGSAMRSAPPHAVLVPGLGCVTAARDSRKARANADLALHSHAVAGDVIDTFDAIDWLSEQDVFDFDYWPLELYKLSWLRPSPSSRDGS